MAGPTPRFSEIFEYHLNLKLQKLVGRPASRELFDEAYAIIRENVGVVFSKSSSNLSTPGQEWLAQQFFEGIHFSSSNIITDDPETWTNTAPKRSDTHISTVPTADLLFLDKIFDGMSFHGKITQELAKRS